MPTREEIREKLDKVYELFGFGQEQRETLKDCTLACLHSQGVVVKKKRELPNYPDSPNFFMVSAHDAYRRAQQDMAGWEAVEPLIEVKG